MLLEEECKNRKGLKKKSILRLTPKQGQPIKRNSPRKTPSLEKILLRIRYSFWKTFQDHSQYFPSPSEIFKALDVSGSGNSKAIAKKLLEKIYPFSVQESSSSLPETHSFAIDPPFTKEEIKRVIQNATKREGSWI
ncbi:hypothetical protein CDAR_614991 [Caerostris darwini]|uniref:Uncharacterized protein n=1 Tax=Caerostris darwini TaxID=1538125 RepID=A0AAV4T8L8_9ARAC|nr:hypothetical protein CDAR_614991 [Caerostris darwini]